MKILSVCSKRTITGHARLSWYASWNKYNFRAGESFFQAVGVWLITGDSALGINMADISSDT